MATPVYPPTSATNILVNTRTLPKIVYLPAASTIGPGRMVYIKDICGNAGVSSIYVSTTGRDSFEGRNSSSTIYGLMNTNFQSLMLASDGMINWMVLQNYTANVVSRGGVVSIVSRGLLQNLDAATYTSGSTWTALVGNNDTLYNTPTTTTAPGGQTVLVFNGSSQYAMDQTGTSATTTFSFDVWFYAAADGNVVSEMGQSGTPNAGYTVGTFGLVSGTIRVGFWTGAAATSISLGSYTTNKWTQASWTYTSGTLIGYVNGVYVATGSQTKSPPTTSYYAIAVNQPTNFGNSSYFNGRIGAYKLYNVVLTADEVKQNYNAFASSRYGLSTI